MIYMNELNLLFLKPKKVAGTSFEIVLSKFASSSDIITPISPGDEKIRHENGFKCAQNYRKPIKKFTANDYYKLVRRRKYPALFFNHISAEEARIKLGNKKFDGALKISIVRNPFETLVSLFHFNQGATADPRKFRDWLRAHPNYLNWNNQQYLLNGKNIIDLYLRYESLSTDIADLEKKIPALKGASELIQKINAKGGIRPSGRSLDEYYQSDKDLIGSVKFFNSKLIDDFGYNM